MSEAKNKLRTSEEAYNKLKSQFDYDTEGEFYQNHGLWIGYKDGKFGPLEQQLGDFVPISQGGDIPFTRVEYVRCGPRILWDRQRRLDELWRSGETESIHKVLAGQRVKGFNAQADKDAAARTAAAIAQAHVTMEEMEKERQAVLEEKKRRKARALAQRTKANEERAKKAMAARPRVDAKPVRVLTVGGGQPRASSNQELRVLTWNAMNDVHADEYPEECRSCSRAFGLARAICEQEPDIVALQEATPAVIEAIDAEWPSGGWRTDGLGELVVWSRHPVSRALSVSLGEGTSKEVLLVEVVVQRRALAFACVHFTSDFHGDNSAKRLAQAKVVRAALADRMPHADAFVCGDFNEPNAAGVESAVLGMEGLTDAWLAKHGPESPGYTFDPTASRLANIGAICKLPRRLDRIFASSVWSPVSALLVGEGREHSDHYGLLATFSRQTCIGAEPVHTSAVVLIPPKSSWDQIDSIRQRFDPSYGRWMPHINLIYGFLPEEHFAEAAMAMEVVMRRYGPLEIRLDELVLFEHASSTSLVVVPSRDQDAIVALQQELEALFPACMKQSSRVTGFQPHLTIGKFDGALHVEDARRWKTAFAQEWKSIHFVASEVCMIARRADQPFVVRSRLPFGALLNRNDCTILESLEAASVGARAFAIGSAGVLGSDRPKSSDFDVLLVGTRDPESVFRDLEMCMNAEWSRRAGGKFALLQMQVGSTKLDVQYARSSSLDHPALWCSATCDSGGQAAAALRDLCALRDAILSARGIVGWQLFQHALLKLKRWAKSRGIDSNALGYLGGFSWSLLLADTMLSSDFAFRGGDPAAAEALVLAMCSRFAQWPWPTPVGLNLPSDGVSASEELMLMPILCPTGSFPNSARNVTASTRATLQEEMLLKVQGKTKHMLEHCSCVVRCQVSATSSARASCVALWLEARLVWLVRRLDSYSARPLYLGHGLYIVGASAEPTEIGVVLTSFRDFLFESDLEGDNWVDDIAVDVVDRQTMNAELQAQRSKRS